MSDNLKHLKKYFEEVTKDKVLKFKTGQVYIVYNPLTDSSREEVASPTDIVHNKYCYSGLRYFVKSEV